MGTFLEDTKDLESLYQTYKHFIPHVSQLSETSFQIIHIARPDVVEWLRETDHMNYRSYNGSFLMVAFKDKHGAMEFKLRFI